MRVLRRHGRPYGLVTPSLRWWSVAWRAGGVQRGHGPRHGWRQREHRRGDVRGIRHRAIACVRQQVYDVGMALVYRRRVKVGPATWLNLSKRGVSVSQRVGRATVSSRGRVFIRLLPGLSWRSKL
jgi:hypothetical protein